MPEKKFFNCNLAEGFFSVMEQNSMEEYHEAVKTTFYRHIGLHKITCHWNHRKYKFQIIITSAAYSMSEDYAGKSGKTFSSKFYASAVGLELFEECLIGVIKRLYYIKD